jgi:hypothetical protein
MSEINLFLAGYGMVATLVLILVLSVRRTAQPPIIVVQQERHNDDPLGCGTFLIFALLAFGAVFIGLLLN